jgi:haloalkane dehalogenase
MGDSDKLHNSGPASYGYFEHRTYLDKLLETLDVREQVTLVLHDWGSALGFDWANRHREALKGIVYMEPIVKPLRWADLLPRFQEIWQGFRSNAGERMILDQNFFIENLLPNLVIRGLSEEEIAEYRRPFTEPGEGRRPMLSWPRQAPMDDERADIAELVNTYSVWLSQSEVPKLYINNDPGTNPQWIREFCRSFRAQMEITVNGRHYLQEDSPDEIGAASATWFKTLE